MKKIIAVSLLSLVSSTAIAGVESLYVSGKMGASIVQVSNQKWLTSDNEFEKTNLGNTHDSVFGGNIAVGYDFAKTTKLPIRTELEFGMKEKASINHNLESFNDPGVLSSSDDAKTDITLNTVMVNTYYDFKNATKFTPYVSVGLGMASINHKMRYDYNEHIVSLNQYTHEQYTQSKTTNNFAWSVGLGSQYRVNNHFSLDMGYRFLDAGKSEANYYADDQKNTSKVKVRSHDIMFGVTYRF
ncbi:porin family protein [Providencia alcalifaciens]|nr:outer membrane beta-barrel protein [Providencia alcalifaciens]ATG15734.1 porin family protein [Providencia alcalifaciens]SQI43062.1 Adhesin/invasin protein PagN [Providencia alcalifaciens]